MTFKFINREKEIVIAGYNLPDSGIEGLFILGIGMYRNNKSYKLLLYKSCILDVEIEGVDELY
jgi:hypothetical protein